MKKLMNTRLVAIVLAVVMLIGLGTAAIADPLNQPPGPFTLSIWHLVDPTGASIDGTPQGQAPTLDPSGALTPVNGTLWQINRVNDTTQLRAAIEALNDDNWPVTSPPADYAFANPAAAHAAINAAIITGTAAHEAQATTGVAPSSPGEARFSNIPAGIYVVRQQVNAAAVAEQLHLPFLVSVPMYVVTNDPNPGDGTWISHVHAFPKAAQVDLSGATKTVDNAVSNGNMITWQIAFGLQPGLGGLNHIEGVTGTYIRVEDALSNHLITTAAGLTAIRDSVTVEFLNQAGQWVPLPRGTSPDYNWTTATVGTTPTGAPHFWPNRYAVGGAPPNPTAATMIAADNTLQVNIHGPGRTILANPATGANLAQATNIRVTLTAQVDSNVPANTGIPNAARIFYGPNDPYYPPPPPPVDVFGLQIRKTNASGNLLPGARFRIYDYNNIVYVAGTGWIPRPAGPGNVPPAGQPMTFPSETLPLFLTTGINTEQPNLGIINILGLQAGRYVIIEEQAPDGYILNNEPLTFEIVPGAPEPYMVNHVRVVGVLNSPEGPGFQLPLTGGAGTIFFTIIGLTLIGGSIVLLIAVRKRSK